MIVIIAWQVDSEQIDAPRLLRYHKSNVLCILANFILKLEIQGGCPCSPEFKISNPGYILLVLGPFGNTCFRNGCI